jgi:hypothetical protein
MDRNINQNIHFKREPGRGESTKTTITTMFRHYFYLYSPTQLCMYNICGFVRYCTIQFDARAYRGPSDKENVEITYKGYFKKSILNNRILLMRGSLHKAYGKFL